MFAQVVIFKDLEVDIMGKMVYQYDIKTPDPDTEAENMIKLIRENLPEEYVMQEKVEIKPMFFTDLPKGGSPRPSGMTGEGVGKAARK